MAGNKGKQRKSSSSSSSSFFCFSLFKSKKQKSGGYYYDDGIKAQKVWPSDEDWGIWGVADPTINKKVKAYLDAQKKKRSSQSE